MTDDLVIVGGFVPSLLIDQEALAADVAPHVGTMDPDVGLTSSTSSHRFWGLVAWWPGGLVAWWADVFTLRANSPCSRVGFYVGRIAGIVHQLMCSMVFYDRQLIGPASERGRASSAKRR